MQSLFIMLLRTKETFRSDNEKKKKLKLHETVQTAALKASFNYFPNFN